MGRSVFGLISSSLGCLNITIKMNSKLILVFFGILVFVAVSAAMSESEEQQELAEVLAAEARVVRDADPRRKKKKIKVERGMEEEMEKAGGKTMEDQKVQVAVQ